MLQFGNCTEIPSASTEIFIETDRKLVYMPFVHYHVVMCGTGVSQVTEIIKLTFA